MPSPELTDFRANALIPTIMVHSHLNLTLDLELLSVEPEVCSFMTSFQDFN